ncbi:G-protein coupled receptor [Aureococcus anophagefferens]|nr:G-protein coupled receptor [Aureococcus anophagefferens]
MSCGRSFEYLDGVLGAAASARSMALATSTAIDETPMVSYMSTSPELNSRSHYPYFLRTILDDAGTVAALADWVASHGWRRVGVVYASDDVYSSANVEAFLKACVAREISATASGYAAHDPRALDVALGTVQSARHAVVVAVPAATELVEVVRGALRRNMTGPDYAWAWVSSRMTTVATDETFDDETRAALAGAAHVTGEFVPLDTPNMDALEEAYKNSTADPNSRMAPQAAAGLGAPRADGCGWGRSFHGYAFDAFAAFALAACAVVDGGGDVADGAALRAALLASDFEGASGRVRFDETTGTRRSDDAIFEVANVWDGAYAVVGRWTAGNWSYAAPFRFADGGTAPPPDTIREPCAPGAARVDVDGVDVCVPCEAGTFAAGGDDACAACAAGRFAADGFGASAASGATSSPRPCRASVDYPSAFSSVLRALRVFELNLGFSPLSCAVDGFDYYDELVFATCAPVAVVAAYKVVVSARALVPGRRDRDEEDSTLAAAVLVAFLVFPSSSSTAMAFWRCRGGFGDGKRYLAADLSVECGGPKYAAYEVFAGLMVCVWPVGVPLCFYALLFRVRDKINPLRKLGFSKSLSKSTSSSLPTKKERITKALRIRDGRPHRVCESVKLLYLPYDPEVWYFEVIETIRRLALTTVQSLVAPGTAANVLYCVVLVLLSAKLYQARQPFAATSDNHLAEALSWLLAAIFLTALLQKTTADGDVAADVALVGLVLLSLTIGACTIFRDIAREKQTVRLALDTIRHAGSSSPSSRDDDVPDDDGAELTPLSPRPPPRDDDDDAGEEGV